MTPDRWQQVKRLFDAAVELEGEQQRQLLMRAGARDPALLAEVELLMHSHEAASTFIDEPLARLGTATDEHATPRQIGPYAIQKTLGRGGMGIVYLAARADEEYQRQVAIKVLQRELTNEQLVGRFRNERQILADLDHPNIARLLEGGTTEHGRPYLVMEYVEGQPLDRYCDEQRLPVARRLELFRKVCRAVHVAHQSLIVHRDLKPGNILVTDNGEPKLLDFGIAKLLGADCFPEAHATTGSGPAPMTLKYASPEQVHGAVITTASDVYSLGVLLYCLLTGQLPYRLQEPHPLGLAKAICEQEPEKPSSVILRRPRARRPDAVAKTSQPAGPLGGDPRKLQRVLRGDLDNILLKALHKEPQHRYASAEELSQDIERYLSHRPILARPGSPLYRAGKFIRRHRWGVTITTLALTVLFGLLGALLVQRGQILRQKTLAESQGARAEEVKRFLVDLFEVSDPALAKGEEVTAREVMDRGAKKITGRLADQPELKAELLETIAEVYRKLAQYEEATPLLEQALTLRRQHSGNEHPSVANTVLLQGQLSRLRSEYSLAESKYREALALLRGVHLGDDPAIERGLSGLANVLRRRRKFREAEHLFHEALAMARRLFGESHIRTASNLSDLGALLRRLDRPAEAEDSYRRALAILRELDDYPLEIGFLLNNLAGTRRAVGDYEGAEELWISALETQRQHYEDDHPYLVQTRFNLASMLSETDRHEEAETPCREALASFREAYGKHPRVADALLLLGRIRDARGDPDEPETAFREAISIWKGFHEGEHPDMAVGLGNLATVLSAKGQRGEAEALLRDALRIMHTAYGAEHRRVAAILHLQGRSERDKGELAAAETLYRKALIMRRKRLGRDHPQVAETEIDLIAVLRESGDHEAAVELGRDALRINSNSFGAEHRRAALAMQSLASVLILLDEDEEAEELARGALEIFEQRHPEGHADTMATQSVLGGSLVGLGRYPEAEPLLLESYRWLEASRGAEAPLTVTTIRRLITLYEAWGKPERVAEIQALLRPTTE